MLLSLCRAHDVTDVDALPSNQVVNDNVATGCQWRPTGSIRLLPAENICRILFSVVKTQQKQKIHQETCMPHAFMHNYGNKINKIVAEISEMLVTERHGCSQKFHWEGVQYGERKNE